MALKKISSPITPLDGTEHLDTLTRTGTYHQSLSRKASAERGYPTGMAGLLEVHNPNEYMVYQRYTVYYSQGMYVRGRYNESWGPWKQILTE